MATTTEEPKSQPTAIGKDAFAAARASLDTPSPEQLSEEKPSDDTSTETPAQEPETVADEPTETTNEPEAILTPEQLAALSPKERANAEKWQAKLTQRAQALSAQEKEFAEWKPLIEALKENPDDVLLDMARQRGFTISQPQVQDTTTAQQEALAGLPEELKFLEPVLKPMLEQYGKTIMQTVDAKLKPVADAHTQMMTEAAAAQTQATLQVFTTQHPEWKKHEAEMVALGQKFQPTAGAMTDGEYLQMLYTLVTAKQSKADQIKETVKQINKSAASVEPNTPGVSESRVEHAMPTDWANMTSKERMRAAYEAAGKGIVWKK